jgi:hypothetical protein
MGKESKHREQEVKGRSEHKNKESLMREEKKVFAQE